VPQLATLMITWYILDRGIYDSTMLHNIFISIHFVLWLQCFSFFTNVDDISVNEGFLGCVSL
jgi:hypothetical protein